MNDLVIIIGIVCFSITLCSVANSLSTIFKKDCLCENYKCEEESEGK